MRCQLARICPVDHQHINPAYVGYLLWVEAKAPTPMAAYGIPGDHPYPVEPRYRTPYLCLNEDNNAVIEPWLVELLPYFSDIGPLSFEEWSARGGEQEPTETGTPALSR